MRAFRIALAVAAIATLPLLGSSAGATSLYTATPNTGLVPGGTWFGVGTGSPYVTGVPTVTVTGTASTWAAVCWSATIPTSGTECDWEGVHDTVDGLWVGSVQPTGASTQMKLWPWDCATGADIGGPLRVHAGENVYVGWVDESTPTDPASLPLLDAVPLTYDCSAPAPGAGFHAVTPFRAWDSRTGPGPVGAIPADSSVCVSVAGVGVVPADATAVVANVTVTGGTAASYLTAYPSGTTRPTTANLLFAPGQTVPNSVTVGIGADGKICLYNQLGTVHVIVDIVGFFGPSGAVGGGIGGGVTNTAPTGDGFFGGPPTRLLDSRNGTGGWASTPLYEAEARPVTVAVRPACRSTLPRW